MHKNNIDLYMKELIVYAETTNPIWPVGINIKAQEIVNQSCMPEIQLIGPTSQDLCIASLLKAKEYQSKFNEPFSPNKILSTTVENFYELNRKELELEHFTNI